MPPPRPRRYVPSVPLPARTLANALAWAVLLGLAALGFVLVTILGPFGLILLGLFTMFVATSGGLREDAPLLSPNPPRAGVNGGNSPEQRAARLAEKHAGRLSIRFWKKCGAVLVLAGILGFAWQEYL